MRGPKDPQYVAFLETWTNIMIIGLITMVVLGIGIFIYYKLRVASIKNLKDRWDFMNKNEVRYYWYSILAISIGIAMLANTADNSTVALSVFWFFIRLFISFAIGTLVGYIIYLILKFYYPGRLQKKLNKLRYTPRISSAGNKMKLLSEEEEDVHLDEGMQAEEDIFSIDYDVWVDDQTGEVRIEKYPGNLIAYKCNNCGFQTMRLKREEILEEATYEKEGKLLKHFECSYCKSIRTTQHRVAPMLKSDEDYKLPELVKFKGEQQVRSIMIEIVGSDGDTREYYFQNLKEAKKFLEEFSFEKVSE